MLALFMKYHDEKETLMTDHRGEKRFARDHLIEVNRNLVSNISRRYLKFGLDREELIAEGNLALVQAARRFDRARDTLFATYASWRIDGAMRDALKRRRQDMQEAKMSFEAFANDAERQDEWDTPLLADYSLDPAAMIDPDDESGRPVQRIVRDDRPCQMPLAQARVMGSDFVVGESLARDPYLVHRSTDFARAKQALAALLARRAS